MIYSFESLGCRPVLPRHPGCLQTGKQHKNKMAECTFFQHTLIHFTFVAKLKLLKALDFQPDRTIFEFKHLYNRPIPKSVRTSNHLSKQQLERRHRFNFENNFFQ